MHTKEIKVPGYADVRVYHNGDWSGDAIVCWTLPGGKQQRVEIPADVLMALARRSAVASIAGDIMSFLEKLEDEDDPASWKPR